MAEKTSTGVGKRLLIVLLLMLGVSTTTGLVIYALRSNIDLFYTPRDVVFGKNGNIPSIGQRLQIGGMVRPNSIIRKEGSLEIEFAVFDKDAEITVYYNDILPDLFEEGQSIVAKGVLEENHRFKADTILAKHDENYTPPEVEAAMDENHKRPKKVYQLKSEQGVNL